MLNFNQNFAENAKFILETYEAAVRGMGSSETTQDEKTHV